MPRLSVVFVKVLKFNSTYYSKIISRHYAVSSGLLVSD